VKRQLRVIGAELLNEAEQNSAIGGKGSGKRIRRGVRPHIPGNNQRNSRVAMPDLAIHPPIHVSTHPDEPIRSLSAAAKFVRRHVAAHSQQDPATIELLARLDGASDEKAADAAGRAFAEWARQHNFLLAMPGSTTP
jgi:hypothetical protein